MFFVGEIVLVAISLFLHNTTDKKYFCQIKSFFGIFDLNPS